MPDVEKNLDPRFRWALLRVFTILGMPRNKWEKFLQNIVDDGGVPKVLDRFFSDCEVAYCFFYPTSQEAVMASSDMPSPAQLKKKAICMHRAQHEADISTDNMREAIVFFEFPKSILESLDKVCRSVYLSMLSNPANQKGWSDLISKDLMDKYHVFLANLHVTVGLRRGETMLPLPPREALSGGNEEKKERVHVLEGAVITWTKQIQHILNQDPEMQLKDGRHPEPLVEIEFWKNKAENLNSIHTQLGDDALRRVLQYLEERKSTYTSPFARLQMDVARAREEANDNNRFLKALNGLLVQLTSDAAEFEIVRTLFSPILHMLLLIWRHSKYYNTPARLVVQIRMICNSIIAHCMRYIPGATVFQMVHGEEATEAVHMLQKALSVASAFKETYMVYKDLASGGGKTEGWSGINTSAAFSRLDSFLGRVKDILEFACTVVHYLKLERVEIGGTRGKTLSATVAAISEEFHAAVALFQAVPYDILDVGQSAFDDDFFNFKTTVRELDRRLGSVLASSFDDLDTMQGRIKLFDIFEGLVERQIIQESLERSYKKLLAQCKADLMDLSRSFVENKAAVDIAADGAPLYHNMPPVAGAIFWVRSLRGRASEHMAKLLFYNAAIQRPLEEYEDVQSTHQSLVQMLTEYERSKYEQWEAESVDSAKEKLKMRLLRRHEKTGLLKVNVDPALVRLLREVRYFLIFDLEIPEVAREIFSRGDTYRTWIGQLDIIVEKYNAVLTELLPVEEPLLEDRIERMDNELSPALTDLRWKSEEAIPDFILRVMTVVCDVSSVVDVLKGNLRTISSVLAKWCVQPLLERKAKPMSPEDFETNHKALVGVKLMGMTEGGKELHKLVKDSSEALKVSKVALTWKAYVDFVNNIVIEGFVAAISVSMQYVCELLDPVAISRNDTQPLFDIKVELRDQDVVFDPPFSVLERGPLTLRSVVDGWLRDFFAMSTMMQRLDTGSGDYLAEIREHFQVQCLLCLVSQLIDNTEMECMKYRQTFMQNSFLWKDSIEERFKAFLVEGACDLVADFRSEEGVPFNQIMQMIGVDLGVSIPPMENFDRQIERFKTLTQELKNMKTPVDIHWLRINASPVKNALVQFAKQWEQKFTGFLHEFTEQRIDSIDAFISKVMRGLTEQSPADDRENEQLLYATMTHIRDVKLASKAMKLLFEPINNQCHLLKKHHVHVDEAKLQVLDTAPAKWEEVTRAAYEEKEKILDLQKIEMGKIRNKIDRFAQQVSDFRAGFLENCPFGPENAEAQQYDKSYALLDEYHGKTLDIANNAREYNNLEMLFDMVLSNYRAIQESQNDLVLLKNLWDTLSMVQQTFLDWNAVLWDKIDTDELLLRVRELQTQVKGLPKGMRGWKLYNWLVEQVKNMSTVLPLINDLHSETMRDRHWTMLMTTTGRSFEKGPDFCFKDLLDLNLHHYADDVSEIVDQSAKEAKIEKKLAMIRSTWTTMQVTFDCSREDCPLLADLGDIVETLEAHALEMMGMTSQGRFIEFCQSVVDEWSGKLRTVEAVLEVWQKVQSNWCRLETIFMLSDDIRSQLPDDSKRFEQLDTQWKDLMMEASQSNLIVDICCAEGREEALRGICDGIDTCEKALNEYLEQKKKAFPRFYFVANQALLDILSNGNQPLKVATYLGDVFDGVKTLDFSKAPDTGTIASGIVAKDGEVVPWNADAFLEGAVETYLTGLEAHIRLMLRDILDHARGSAELWEVEQPREYWLENYCAQLALVTTQIIWTEETARVFEDLDSGSETAMKDYKRICDDRIEKLIKRVQTKLSKDLRTKVITVITIDVHARDVIETFAIKRLTDATAFAWQAQLRFHWQLAPKGTDLVSFTPEDQKTCVIKICDWVTIYLYEYVGNCGRLVITPLTDRCYITLSQALNLTLGGAPAGPAGTGKTETTKDLSRAIGLPIVVFNCSDQMTYLTMAQIFMGLAQTGAWGCFDEFNRISIEVLSVVSTQYKSILDAIREKGKTFIFMDDEIRLIPTIGAFITMNPGYAGRTELPENLKALFRSCAMIVPDLTFICENMLMSEGFIIARPLSRKFVTLYSLCKELLSKQMHYDWGLRAVKSLLRQAGTLKRKEPDADENPVLCRALRDFNTPKITTNDMPIFLRLIKDLFPGIWPDAFQDPAFEKVCSDVVKRRGLQADAGFVTKVVGLLDILGVRHCCFIIGPSGCSKTECWKSLLDAVREIGQEGQWEQVNPKAITSDELYGIMTKTKEWKDGAIAVIMRNMSKEINGYKSSHVHKWVVLDGDIDATWIESMNTVMDDNKVLTLVSNERIPFTPTMRMLLEIQDMKHASPATVSRGGVLFINEADVGWKPYMESWGERMDPVAQSVFYLLFSTYFESNMDSLRKNFQFSCPMLDMAFVQSITCFIDALMMCNTKENMEALRQAPTDEQKVIYEAYFIFAMMWTIGGAVADDKIMNYRKAFTGWMKATAKVKFPDQGDCFDYRYEATSKEWVHWDQWVIPYAPVAERMYQNIVISSVEIERMKYILDLHVSRQKPSLFVGVAGTGKTTLIKDYLTEVKTRREDLMSASINHNSYTSSYALQRIMMGYLDKRTGRTYGPPSNKKCLYFIDDLNMPELDMYDTQSAIMLITQVLAYGSIFDRDKLEERRDLTDIMFTACMNPKSGSFMVNQRLQRRFTVITTYTPTPDTITGIFSKILGKHLELFTGPTQKLLDPIIGAMTETLLGILSTPCFLPSATKFFYQFNLKDISNVFQGLLNTNPAQFREGPMKFLRVWLHECKRVFADRLTKESDEVELQGILDKTAAKHFTGIDRQDLFAEPLIFTSFVSVAGGNDKLYLPVKEMANLKKVIEDKLSDYNETYAAMNLVLFDMALRHVCRISRITDLPCGNALLVGVGGSGKQSLSRLASFINGQDVLTILVNQSYGLPELKTDLQEFYKKAAVKPGTPHAFLMTDGQIADERFLVYINDMLSSGNIPELFTREEYDALFGNIRNLAKAAGYPDDRDSLFAFFIDRVRKNLHMILCHSPVGDAFRIRGRKFPALISCMVIDVFQPWPRDALQGVAAKFLVDLLESRNIASEELLNVVSAHMAEVHLSIDVANAHFLEAERRYNYTTPKSFLELISFYMKMLVDKQSDVEKSISRLEKGLAIMEQVQSKVEGLKEDLKITMLQVEEKKVATDALIEQVTTASAEAAVEKEAADEEAVKTNEIAATAATMKSQADLELQEAMPAMEAAKDAVDCLKIQAIQELKALPKPPGECVEVCAAIAFLLKGEKKKIDWKAGQKMMNNPGAFLEEIRTFNADDIPDFNLANVAPIMAQPFFNYETMKGKSSAAAHLTNWCVNIVKYNSIYKNVAPLMVKVKQASEDKVTAEEKLAVVLARVKEVQERVAELEGTLQNAVTEKEAVEQQAARCLEKLSLAERLVNGLADEYTRWTSTVQELQDLGVRLTGNCLLASAFVGYISPFNSAIRVDLWKTRWIGDMIERQIPLSEKIDPLRVLASEADVAAWQNEGLPADRVSVENAAVVTSCARWPLMIDPQLQGVKWIRQRIGEDLTVVQFTMSNWLNKVVFSIQMGGQLLLEAVGSEIDAILEPLLSRSVIKRGRSSMIIRIGGEEVDYDPKFQLYLQSKLPNPHYRPEIAAQCTIINFIVTPEGLEDQILAMVVREEKPELEQQKQELVRRQNEFKVTLLQLEDDLLSQLSAADPASILDNFPLIEGLEKTKATSAEINDQVAIANQTEEKINLSRELYRPVAAEGSMLFFLVIQLCVIEHMYQYSLESFVRFLFKAIDRAEQHEDVAERSAALIRTIRMTIFRWVNRGLFERHKLIFCAMLTFKLFALGQLPEEYKSSYFNFLMRGPTRTDVENPIVDWLPNPMWFAVQKLIELEGFELFAQNMEKDAPNRFKEWFNEMTPEEVKLPLDWKRLDAPGTGGCTFQKLLVLRCLRPDRMASAMAEWIRNTMPNGRDYIDCDSSASFFSILANSFEDSTNVTPLFFILSPGADPVKEVEQLGRKLIGLQANVNYHNVAMGQGQDTVAMAKLDLGHKEGHWVMLQNIHLMPRWCVELEKKLDTFAAEGSHLNFRVFLSADPAKGIPIGILERSIKLTNEPPQGLLANLRRAFANFNREDFEDRDAKVKSILFGLCHFHALMLERKKFGPLGYNMMYPFSAGDLRDSASVLYNYLEGSSAVKIPWDDLRYIFGEIMYGGHVVDDWDRKMCATYLNYFMQDELLDETEMVPYADGKLSWPSPPPGPHEKYIEHIETMPAESPLFFGMHPNAEIGFRTTQCTQIFELLSLLQPRDSSASGEGSDIQSPMARAEQLCNDFYDEVRDISFPVDDLTRAMSDEEKGPYQFVFLQECEYMNVLTGEMVRSLKELQLGLKGELTMSPAMETLAHNLYMEKIPAKWAKYGFASTRALMSWLANLKERCEQLNEWCADPLNIPKVVDIAKLFNPQSFLTAIKQLCCQQQQLELDKLQVFTEVTKREAKQIDTAARDGAFVTGMFLEGARWDVNGNCLEESKPKDMFFKMPVVNCKAALVNEREEKNTYICPTYCVPTRRPYYVFPAQLRTKQPAAKWVLAGVALILDIGNAS